MKIDLLFRKMANGKIYMIQILRSIFQNIITVKLLTIFLCGEIVLLSADTLKTIDRLKIQLEVFCQKSIRNRMVYFGKLVASQPKINR